MTPDNFGFDTDTDTKLLVSTLTPTLSVIWCHDTSVMTLNDTDTKIGKILNNFTQTSQKLSDF